MSSTNTNTLRTIENFIPHRHPFLFIDSILHIQPGESCTATAYFEEDNPIFKGHFPRHPILPGVIILECLAQASIPILTSMDTVSAKNKVPLLAEVKQAKFIHPILPGERILLETKLEKIKCGIGIASGNAMVGNKLCAKATWVFSI